MILRKKDFEEVKAYILDGAGIPTSKYASERDILESLLSTTEALYKVQEAAKYANEEGEHQNCFHDQLHEALKPFSERSDVSVSETPKPGGEVSR